MSSLPYRVRRATLDDLPALRKLWTDLNLPLNDMEKRFTEVQVAETPEGQIVGALGIKVERLHGQIHSEAISNETLYDVFWERLKILSRNFGLFRLWTDSVHPYWQGLGFRKPDEKTLEKLPSSFGAPEKLLTLGLKEESSDGLTVEQQFEIFTQAQKLETDQMIQQAQTLKKIAYSILAVCIFGLLAVAAVWFIKSPAFRQQFGGR